MEVSLNDEHMKRAIADTLPTGPGERNRCVFELARELKALPNLDGCDTAQLRPIVREWHAKALPFIRTRPFEETWSDFCVAWDRVEYPADQIPLDAALAQAKADPPPEAAKYEQPALRLLVGVCYWLAQKKPSGVFYLSVRAAAGMLGVKTMTVWRWLKMLCVDRVLDVVEKGNVMGRATRYQWLGALSPADSDDIPF